MKAKSTRSIELIPVFCAVAWLGLNVFLLWRSVSTGYDPKWGIKLSFSGDGT